LEAESGGTLPTTTAIKLEIQTLILDLTGPIKINFSVVGKSSGASSAKK